MVKKLILRMIALVAAMLLLTGCADMERLRNYLIEDYIAYSDMEYSRPDMQQLDEALEAAIEASGVLILLETSSPQRNILCSPSINLSSTLTSSVRVEIIDSSLSNSAPFLRALSPTVL